MLSWDPHGTRGGDVERSGLVVLVGASRTVSPADNAWTANGVESSQQFDATITEQHPDEQVAWPGTSGVEQSGCEPAGVVEQVGTMVGADDLRVKADLKRFNGFS